MKRINFLLFNDRVEYEMKCRGIIVDSYIKNKKSKWWMVSKYDMFSRKYSTHSNLLKALENKFTIDALVRREEHGRLWLETENWKNVVDVCYSKKILPMSFDFGYFAHYQTYMVDVYNKDGGSNIIDDWESMSDTVVWDDAPEYIRTYRNKFLKKLFKYKKLKPLKNLKEKKYAVIWTQAFLDLLKPQFKNEKSTRETEVSDWVNQLCEVLLDNGITPVIKGNPGKWRRMNVKNIKFAVVYANFPDQVKDFPESIYENNINQKLIAHAKYHIVSCSSVTNELVLADAPVIAMGKSWFTGLDIFNEPTNWENLLKDPLYINQKNRNKWINWWLSRQVAKDGLVSKFTDMYNKYSPLIK